jgi:hypothetical protein
MADKKDQKKDHKNERFVDVGRAETEIHVPDPDINEVFESDQRGHGARSGGRQMQREMADQRGFDRDVMAGDPDAMIEDSVFVGEEAPGGGQPTPDQDIVDEIGEAVGLEYQDNEPLHTTEKVEERDRHRWELDPASSEDYKRRVNHEGE